ncbi:hypothetical protein PTE30175_01103 [Pandoraea terrae]|uniref:Lipoprotein n=1 Tax=Pandoraea terrae TaxID=1537710 RepID=A0A5E4T5R3_9BURK|nr:hypothetical protein [Pandoraea terrae]VVD81804.1 hypothetical protein PTE30175_01103 [Pandoraea terrae]
MFKFLVPFDVRIVVLRALVTACGTWTAFAIAQAPPSGVAIIVSGVDSTNVDQGGVAFAASRRALRQTESAIADCIERAVAARYPHVAITRPDDFYRLAFPALTSEEAPRSLESLTILLQDAAFRERLSAAGFGYLIVAGGTTEHREREGSVNLFVLQGGYGGGRAWFWGTAVWDNTSKLTAYVIDLKRQVTDSEVTAAAKDNSSFGIYLYLPVGKPSMAQIDACRQLGTAVAQALAKVTQP